LGREGGSSGGTALADRRMIDVVALVLCLRPIFGTSDTSSIGHSDAMGMKAYGGPVLVPPASGTVLSAWFYGTRSFLLPLWKQFVFGSLAVAIGASLFMVITGLPVLAAARFVTGFAVAPTIISGNNLVQQFVPRHRLTEGLAWTGTSIGLGFALGSAVAGRIIDTYGARSGFYAVFAAAAIAAATALACAPVLRRRHLAALQENVNGHLQ